jgi:hypothetical protein
MARNKLLDLNNHLFAQLERLSDEELKGDELKEEISRSKQVALIGDKIIQNSRVLLDAKKLYASGQVYENELPEMLQTKTKL